MALIRRAHHDPEGAEIAAREAVRLGEWYVEDAKDATARANVLPVLSESLWTLAHILAERRSWTQAIQACRRLTVLLPNSEKAWFALGTYTYESRLFDESATAYGAYARLQPNEPAAWQRLALALGNAGRVSEAFAASARLRTLDSARADTIDAWLRTRPR